MQTTTIKLQHETKKGLDLFREYKDESYDEILKKLVYVAVTAKKQPKLSQKTVRVIEAARKRVQSGDFVTHEEVKRKLGYS